MANVPASVEVISIRWHSGASTLSRGTLAITTLRSVMATCSESTVTNNEFRLASLAFCGARPSTIPPLAGIPRITSQGTVAFMDTGVSEISGAVTLLSSPFCGQFNVAVVCTTGSSGVITASTNPSRPAMVATQRVTFTSSADSRALSIRTCVMGGL